MNQHLKYFKKLGIPPTTDVNLIKKAYRKKAMRVHPDKNPSEHAQKQFIELSEAYEILTGVEKTTKRPPGKQKTAEEVRTEKIRNAKKRYQKMRASEKEKDARYFEKITTGWQWKLFKALSFYSLFFGILLCADYFLTGEQKAIPEIETYSFLPQAVKAEGELFEVDEDRYWTQKFPPVRLNYGFFFKDLKSISIIDEPVNIDDSTSPSDRMTRFELFDHFESKQFYSYGSVYYVFPFFHFFLVLPVLLVYFKRPSISFAIGRLIAIWVIFPCVVLLSFSNFRIFHLFGLF